jgi:hypothetical protein
MHTDLSQLSSETDRRPSFPSCAVVGVKSVAVEPPFRFYDHFLALIAFVSFAAICSQGLGQASNPLDTDAAVADIVREVVSRHGGQQAIERWNCGTITYSARGGAIPADGVATHTEAFDFPGRFRRLATIEFPGVRNQSQMVAVINQRGSWLVINDGEPIASDGTFAQRDRHSFADVISVAHLEGLVNDITKGEVLDVDRSPALRLTLAVEQANPVDYLIDVQTGLLALMSKRGFDPTSGRESTIETRFDSTR